MAKKLNQQDLLKLTSIGTPPTDSVAFGAKSDGLYQKIGTVESKLTTQSDIDTAINGIEIGGRNYLPLNPLFFESGSITGIEGRNVHNTKRIRLKNLSALPEGDLVLSGLSDEVEMGIWYYDSSGNGIGYNYWITSDGIITAPEGTAFFRYVLTYSDQREQSNVTDILEEVEHLQLEKGNKATDWIPAPEDQVSDWSTTDATSFSYIKNKPTQLSQFTDNIGVGTHIANKANPHGVTTSQIGAVNLTTNQAIGGVKTFNNNLQINGRTSIDGQEINIFLSGSRGRIMYGENTTSDSKVAFGSGWSTIDDFAVFTKTSGSFSEATQRFTVKMGGNVGIGTTNPLYKLDVSGTGRFTGNVTAPTFIGKLTGLASLNLPLTGGTLTGSLGIGVTNPLGKLNIESALVTNSSQTSEYPLLISHSTDANDSEIGIAFRTSFTQTGETPGAAITHHREAAWSFGGIRFKTRTGSTAGQPLESRMIITGSGNVGIGTTSPAYKLDVSGDVRATGTFRGSLTGNASTATALTTDAGSETQPIYFSGGKPVATSHSLGKSVPSTAVFTDTNTYVTQNSNTTSSYRPILLGQNSTTSSTSNFSNVTNQSYYSNALRMQPSTGNIITKGSITVGSQGNSNQWDTAYGWGNHADKNYLTSYVDTKYKAGTGLELLTSGGTNTFNVKLSDSISTTSSTTAATSSAVRLAYNRGSTGITNAATAQTKADSAYTLASGKEDKFTKNGAFNKNFGTAKETVAQGNDSRINNGQTAYGWGNHASKGYATETYVDNIEIGGRNLIPINTGVWERGSIDSGDGSSISNNARLRTIDFLPMESNQNYYLSIHSEHNVGIFAYDEDDNYLGWSAWQTQSAIIQSHTGIAKFRMIITKKDSTNITLDELKNIIVKLEKGNKATDWTPTPEDQVSDWNITDATSFSFIKNKPTKLSQFDDNIGVGTHIANKANPHNVTTAQIGAVNLTTAQTITGVKTFNANIILGANRYIRGTDDVAGVWNVDNLLWRFGSRVTGSITNIRSEKVGIDTDNPLYKLDVAGTGRFTGNLRANAGVNTPKVDFGNGFTIEPSGTELVFKYNNVIKQRMLSDGSIVAVGEVTAITE